MLIGILSRMLSLERLRNIFSDRRIGQYFLNNDHQLIQFVPTECWHDVENLMVVKILDLAFLYRFSRGIKVSLAEGTVDQLRLTIGLGSCYDCKSCG